MFKLQKDNPVQKFFSSFLGGEDKGLTEEEKAWKKYIPMSKEQAEEILTQDLPPGTKVELTVNKNGQGKITITAEDIIEESRVFDLKDHRVFEDFDSKMIIDDAGKGYGRSLMRNEIEFFSTCGVKRFEISAELAAGGYVWARLGFLPDNLNMVKSAMGRRFENIKSLLTDKEQETVQEIIEFKDEKDLWRLADTQIDMLPRLRDAFKKAHDGNVDAQGIVKSMYYVDFEKLDERKSVPMGSSFLAASRFLAHLDFDNKEQMDRAEKYVGGWKTCLKKSP